MSSACSAYSAVAPVVPFQLSAFQYFSFSSVSPAPQSLTRGVLARLRAAVVRRPSSSICLLEPAESKIRQEIFVLHPFFSKTRCEARPRPVVPWSRRPFTASCRAEARRRWVSISAFQRVSFCPLTRLSVSFPPLPLQTALEEAFSLTFKLSELDPLLSAGVGGRTSRQPISAGVLTWPGLQSHSRPHFSHLQSASAPTQIQTFPRPHALSSPQNTASRP